ncbi:methyltransferase domain-containing protein [Kribbella shirazensis]|uniref:SAM-dependent methyltransferase n=1 Tax=Kribbella shirazensis TaxID=1105143 RepID=A0A7X5V683_9ACTN|nr:SAM-dependent methyltransferase [Kribbella shirazensis]
MDPWQTLTTDYEDRRAREDSLDRLMEWDAQRSLIGPVAGRSVLDVGCGNGGKAIELAVEHGAASVVGVDIGAEFRTPPAGVDVAFHTGDLSVLDELEPLQDRRFDVVLFLQSLAYATDRARTLRAVRSMMADDGVLVVSMAHPIRYAVERSERDGVGIGDAYHAVGPYSYPSLWNPEITVTHTTDTFSTIHNSLTDNGFRVEHVLEPQLSDENKQRYPHKQEWLSRYVGIIILRARPA